MWFLSAGKNITKDTICAVQCASVWSNSIFLFRYKASMVLPTIWYPEYTEIIQNA